MEMATEEEYWKILNRVTREKSEEDAGESSSDATEGDESVPTKEEHRQPA